MVNGRMEVSTSEIFPQILYAAVVVGIVYILFMGIEILWRAYLGYGTTRVVVFPKTTNMSKIFHQDPSNRLAIQLPVSQNQLTGIEFSYSTFIYVTDSTFSNNTSPQKWSTVFYKGYESGPFPLCGPGVFVSSNKDNDPVLRVIMNSYNSWFNHVDITQIPVNKWFHLALVLSSNNTLNVYVNGNLANKLILEGTIAYQNYQPLMVLPPGKTVTDIDFNNTSTTNKLRGIPPGESFVIGGPITGYISNIIYYSYAIGYAEIQALLQMGPSSEMDTESMVTPPYLIDTWWTQQR
jgi:hypothetical protein